MGFLERRLSDWITSFDGPHRGIVMAANVRSKPPNVWGAAPTPLASRRIVAETPVGTQAQRRRFREDQRRWRRSGGAGRVRRGYLTDRLRRTYPNKRHSAGEDRLDYSSRKSIRRCEWYAQPSTKVLN